MNHYPHHIGDYLKDTAHLDPLEDGIYRRLLDLYYTQEGPLERDLTRLCRRIRIDEKKHGKTVESLLSEFFDDTSAGWAHYRCDTEIGKYREKSEKARKSVAVRWKSERNTNVETNVIRMDSEKNTNQNQNQLKEASPAGEADPVWGIGIKVFTAVGLSETQSRTFLGMLLGTWEKDDVLEALQAAQGKADPRGYVRGVLKGKAKKSETAKAQQVSW